MSTTFPFTATGVKKLVTSFAKASPGGSPKDRTKQGLRVQHHHHFWVLAFQARQAVEQSQEEPSLGENRPKKDDDSTQFGVPVFGSGMRVYMRNQC